jgi:hypothetical protein
MKDEKLLKIMPLILFLILVIIPMFALPRDMWDGTIIEYASLTKNFSGLQSYFSESTWFLQYPLSVAMIKISDFFGISYKNANAFFVLFLMYIFLRETFLFANNQIKLSKVGTYLATFLVATFSVWGDLLSSIMTLHFACMALGLFALRAIHAGARATKFVGFLGLGLSLSLQSQLAYLPVLSYIYDLSKKDKFQKIWMVRPSSKTALVFLISFTLYVVVRNLYPPHGLYENYNNLILTTFNGALIVWGMGLAFATFLYPIIMVVFCIIFLTEIITNSKQSNLGREQVSINPRWLVWLLALFFAGAFPYMAVGKASTLWTVTDWSGRQAFLIVFPTALITAVYLQILYEKARTLILRRAIFIGAIAILVLNTTLLSFAVLNKLNRQIFVSQLEGQLKLKANMLRPGLLEILSDGIPGPQLRNYESNFLMYSAIGKANWWTRVGDKRDESFSIPCYIQQNPAYQIKYIYNYDPSHIKNYTIVKIQVAGFKGPVNLIRNVFGWNPAGRVELVSVNHKTIDPLQKTEDCN